MSAPRSPWWCRGLEGGIFVMTLLALIAMSRVRGPEWVVAPLSACLVGAVLYRVTRRFLFRGVEALLVIGYFVAVKLMYDAVGGPAMGGSSLVEGLDVVGLVILYPAQVALWTGRRSLQELVLLGLVAISQFLYGMTLSQPWEVTSWMLGIAFFPTLIYSLLQYATAFEIEASSAAPHRPRTHSMRFAALSMGIVPLTLVFGAAVFYLLPRYSTLTRAVSEWNAPPADLALDERNDAAPGGGRRMTGLGDRIRLAAPAGAIMQDNTRVLMASVRLLGENRALGRSYADRIHLRSDIFSEYDGTEWIPDEDGRRTFTPDERGVVELTGPRVRNGWGTATTVWPLLKQKKVVSFGRPHIVQGGVSVTGTPTSRLSFSPALRPGKSYTVLGERVLAWVEAKPMIRRLDLAAVHPDQSRYTFLPDRPAADDVRRLARHLTRGRAGTIARVDAILEHLATLDYSLEVRPPKDTENPTASFLFKTKTGHCEFFSDALAVLLRHVGIPSRVVAGYAGGEYRARTIGGRLRRGFEFRARDAHAWVEVFFSGLGWVSVEAYPRGVPSVGSTPRLDAPDFSREKTLLEPDVFTSEEQLSLYRSLARGLPASPAWWIVGALGAFVLMAIALRLLSRGGGGEATVSAPADGGDTAFNPLRDLLAAFAACGLRPRVSETPLEVGVRAERSLSRPVVPVVERVYASAYGDRPFSIGERDAFARWIHAVRASRVEPLDEV